VALTGVERVFTAQTDFDPASSTREFSLLVSDYGVAVIGDTLAALLAEEAPHARLRFIANSPSAVDRAEQVLLSTDLLVLPHGFVSELSHRDLYRDEWVCIVAADNEAVGEELTVADLESLPWVVTFHGPTAATPAARQMRMRGIELDVQVVTESFLTVPGLVAGSRRIALLQRRLVELLPLNLGIRALAPPVEVGQLVEAMWWHPAFDDDPEHAYLRDVVARATELAVGGTGAVISNVDTGAQK
jgi:DNA-binding transcriptional LysR family regulator